MSDENSIVSMSEVSESGKQMKQKHNADDFILEYVLGVTNTSSHALASNQLTGHVAFPAASLLVLLNPTTHEQKFIETPSLQNSISCVAFSQDDRLVGFGESGFKANVSVWLVKEFKPLNKFPVCHARGASALVFHPRKTLVILMGSADLTISVYDYMRGQKVALSRWQTKPRAMAMPKDGSYVVVCGHRKITMFSINDAISKEHETNYLEEKRAVLLGCQSEYTFLDIICGKGRHEKDLYTITACGYLCLLKLGGILLDNAAKIDARLTCVRYGLDLLFVGCPEGVVKICSPDNLGIAAVVSLSDMLGPGTRPKIDSKPGATTSAIAVNERNSIVTCVYSDCSIYSWQVRGTHDSIECTAIMPSYCKKKCEAGDAFKPEETLNDHMHRENILRQYISSSVSGKTLSMTDPNILASRNRKHGYLGVIDTLKETHQQCQYVDAVRISPDGKVIISGDDQGEIKVYDATTGVVKRVIEAHNSQVTYVEVMYDSQYKLVCSGGRDRVIFLLDADNDFGLVQVMCDHSAAITAISLVHSNDELTLVSGAADGVILIRRSIANKKLYFSIIGQVSDTRGNQTFSWANSVLAAGTRNGDIHVFTVDPILNSKPTRVIPCQKAPNGCQGAEFAFRSLDIDPSGSFLAVGRNNGQTHIYHLQTGQSVATLSNQKGLNMIKFTGDLRYMISSSFKGCSLVWKLPERMTDFMKSKLCRICTTEVSNEISYEHYMSCVRVCQHLNVSETESNEEDSSAEGRLSKASVRTPSIQSLNLLNDTQTSEALFYESTGGKDDEREGGDCARSSFNSCSSTCSRSSSRSSSSSSSGSILNVLHSYTTSDASVRMNSLPNPSVKRLLDSEFTDKTSGTSIGSSHFEAVLAGTLKAEGKHQEKGLELKKEYPFKKHPHIEHFEDHNLDDTGKGIDDTVLDAISVSEQNKGGHAKITSDQSLDGSNRSSTFEERNDNCAKSKDSPRTFTTIPQSQDAEFDENPEPYSRPTSPIPQLPDKTNFNDDIRFPEMDQDIPELDAKMDHVTESLSMNNSVVLDHDYDLASYTLDLQNFDVGSLVNSDISSIAVAREKNILKYPGVPKNRYQVSELVENKDRYVDENVDCDVLNQGSRMSDIPSILNPRPSFRQKYRLCASEDECETDKKCSVCLSENDITEEDTNDIENSPDLSEHVFGSASKLSWQQIKQRKCSRGIRRCLQLTNSQETFVRLCQEMSDTSLREVIAHVSELQLDEENDITRETTGYYQCKNTKSPKDGKGSSCDCRTKYSSFNENSEEFITPESVSPPTDEYSDQEECSENEERSSQERDEKSFDIINILKEILAMKESRGPLGSETNEGQQDFFEFDDLRHNPSQTKILRFQGESERENNLTIPPDKRKRHEAKQCLVDSQEYPKPPEVHRNGCVSRPLSLSLKFLQQKAAAQAMNSQDPASHERLNKLGYEIGLNKLGYEIVCSDYRDTEHAQEVVMMDGEHDFHTHAVETHTKNVLVSKGLLNTHREEEDTRSTAPTLVTKDGESTPVGNEGRGCKYSSPLAQMFKNQDDYLKKLKEVREKFEMSIQALSAERCKSCPVSESSKQTPDDQTDSVYATSPRDHRIGTRDSTQEELRARTRESASSTPSREHRIGTRVGLT